MKMSKPTVTTISGVFDYTRYQELQTAYDRAISREQPEFLFGAHRLMINYAAHLLEYLRIEFEARGIQCPSPSSTEPSS